MKTRYYLILVLVAICSGIGTSFGQYPEHMPQAMISLYTDKQNYGYNDTVIISGDIDKNDFKSLSWLDVEIRDPSGVIFKNDVIPINNTGHYTYKITISQNFTSGQYLVRVSNPYYHEADLGNSFYVNVGNQIMPKNDLGDGNVFNMQASDFGLPGDTIEIKGNLVTKDSIKIMLHDPDGNTRYSATTFADRNGEFTSQLKVPSNAVSGLWKIVGDSGIYHRELNFTVSGYSSSQTCYGFHCTQSNSSGTTTWPNIHGNNSSTLQTPLKQFKSGIAANDVKCEQGLQLVFKTEDSSPACVKPDTASKLVERGWMKNLMTNPSTISPIKNSQKIYDITNNTKQCEIPLVGKEGYIPVMYMPVNSVGKICVEYHSNYATKVGLLFYDATPSQNSSKSITVTSKPQMIPEGISDVVFTIKTGNQTGFFGAELFCVGRPFAVGYDNQSSITENDFPWMKYRIIHCPMAIYTTQVLGVHGIGIRYVPNTLIS